MDKQSRIKDGGLAVAVLAVLLVFYWPFLTGERAFFFKDTTHFFEPLCRFIGETLAHGRLPLWNPYNYCGMPQAAISSPSVFFPLNWLFAVMPFSAALASILMLSQLICAAGTFGLIRAFGWSRLAALVGALAVGLSGYMFSLSSNYTLVATAAWLPVSLLCSWRLSCAESDASRRRLWMVANALSFAMLLSAGRPEIAAPSVVLIMAVGIFGWRRGVQPQCFLLSMLIGTLIAMPTILPALEWLPLSRRSTGLPASEILMYSANWFDLFSIMVLAPLGDLQLREHPFSAFVVPGAYIPYYGSAFVGSIVIALAAIGLSRRGGLFYWGGVCVLAGSIVLALGYNVPFLPAFIPYLPGASLLRFPSKLLFFTDLSLALFAARGLELYLRGHVRVLPHLVAWLILAFAALAIRLSPQIVLPFYPVPHRLNDAMLAQVILALRLLADCIFVLLILAALSWAQRKGRATAGAGFAVMVIACCLLAYAFTACRQGAPGNYYHRPSFVLAASHSLGASRADRITALYPERLTLPAAYTAAGAIESTVRDFQYSRQMLKPFTNIDFAARSAFGFEGAMVRDYYYLFLNLCARSSQFAEQPAVDPAVADLPLARLLSMTSTSQVVTQCVRFSRTGQGEEIPLLANEYFERVWEDRQLNARLYRLKSALPRCYLAASWRSESHDEVLKAIADAGGAFDPAKITLVENDLPITSHEFGNVIPLAVAEDCPERLVIDVQSDGNRLLVLQDQYYPGWIATVDGRETAIYCVNGFMRGLIVGAGTHKVVFAYAPKSVYGGMILCFLGLVLCAVSVAHVWIRRRGEHI